MLLINRSRTMSQLDGGDADIHEPTKTIANRLGIIQLIAFRGVCKSWRAASFPASAHLESAAKTAPCFIVYNDQDKKCSLYYEEDKDANKVGRKKYELSIPEFENATCLASNHGWLLLNRHPCSGSGAGSLFFLCPFSRARIDLPEIPESDISGYVGAFSGPPTSPECIVTVAN
ncbi:OLC1v1007507C1 [Oldenlandia corymbosa var. corymbosa]|uniref:OLC1v1007507C1 n=1 Tax=Oldenlandia corymbosa var. corymbosa TaxID=529605 RepID=A0AAV1DMK2_OLDCO|nr:OLC1v1007507C1 [Oldenlandia corymbosa var. corymbosa]